MAVKKKKTTTQKSAVSKKMLTSPKKEEKLYSYRELADFFGISRLTARAYFNMCNLDYDTKITIEQAQELFKKF